MNQENKGKDEKVIRLYADGVFDNFHIGHANVFKQCRQLFPNQKVWMIAGVPSQAEVERRKGPTISSEMERYAMVKQCRYVDQVIQGAPWTLDEKFLDDHKIDFVCHDEQPYKTLEGDDCYAFVKKLGKFKATKRTEGVSTTDVVGKILKNRSMYIQRNLNRGAKPADLGLSFPMYWYYQLKIKLCPARNHEKKQ